MSTPSGSFATGWAELATVRCAPSPQHAVAKTAIGSRHVARRLRCMGHSLSIGRPAMTRDDQHLPKGVVHEAVAVFLGVATAAHALRHGKRHQSRLFWRGVVLAAGSVTALAADI